MSALPCGCDTESLWMCEEHRPKTGTTRDLVALLQMQQFKDRLEHADAMGGTDSATATRTEAAPSPAEQFRAAAVAKATAAVSLHSRDCSIRAGKSCDCGTFFTPAATAAAVDTRDDLMNRIATLEAELNNACRASAVDGIEMRQLLAIERRAHESDQESFNGMVQLLERIASILARFYTEPLSLSSVQPLIALALELNPDLVERAR